MPFALLLIGLALVITGARGTYEAFGKQLKSDFTGPGNFVYWVAALGAVGAVGYSDDLKPVSRAFMALILISFVLKNGGVFEKFAAALKSGPITPAAIAAPSGDVTTSQTATPTTQTSSAQENFKTVVGAAKLFL